MSSRIEQIIEEIEEYVDSCKFQPLSSTKIVVNKEELEELLRELRMKTPDEIKRYQKIISNKDAILADAQSKADAIIADAKTQAQQMVTESELCSRHMHSPMSCWRTPTSRHRRSWTMQQPMPTTSVWVHCSTPMRCWQIWKRS